jgi:transcriptional regulator with XRE-family HTH domain
MDMAAAKHLGDFLREEMRKRKMSNHAFADFIGVSHTTINKLVDFGYEDVGYPSLDFLIKLAQATQVDIRYLVTLVVPQSVLINGLDSTPRQLYLSKQIEKLEAPYQQIIELIIQTELGSK